MWCENVAFVSSSLQFTETWFTLTLLIKHQFVHVRSQVIALRFRFWASAWIHISLVRTPIHAPHFGSKSSYFSCTLLLLFIDICVIRIRQKKYSPRLRCEFFWSIKIHIQPKMIKNWQTRFWFNKTVNFPWLLSTNTTKDAEKISSLTRICQK